MASGVGLAGQLQLLAARQGVEKGTRAGHPIDELGHSTCGPTGDSELGLTELLCYERGWKGEVAAQGERKIVLPF